MKKCKCCQKIIPEVKAKNYNIFCNLKCQHDYQHNEYIRKWLTGEISSLTKQGDASNHVRRYALNRANHKCELCEWAGINPFSKKLMLIMDHIDGNPYNNRPENLRMICPNCDSLTSTYKGMNRGNGRHIRRERYKAGKSF